MKVLHVIANLAPRYGGPPKACVDMGIALAARGHDVHIFTTDQDGLGRLAVPKEQPENVQGVRIRYFASTLRYGWPMSISLGRALAKRITNYDIVHIHSLYLFHGLVAGHFCRKYEVPYVICPHGALDPFMYKRHRYRKAVCEVLFERRNIRGAAGVHFTTDEERELAKPYIGTTPSFVVPLGLHLDEYANLPAAGNFRRAYPEVGERKILLHLGRLNFKKGLDILVEAFARVIRERKDLHLVLVGPDNEGYGVRVKRWLARRGLSDRATFSGMLQGEMKLSALRAASVFALPSYSENFGIAVVEAMACGVPVVISNKVNIWREVETAGAGLVTGCDTESFTAALSKVLDDHVLAARMRESGRTLVAKQFDWFAVSGQLEAAYRDILSTTGRSGARSRRVWRPND